MGGRESGGDRDRDLGKRKWVREMGGDRYREKVRWEKRGKEGETER